MFFDREPLEVELENERLRNRNGELELQIAKLTGEKPKGAWAYMVALYAQHRRQEELPDYFGTWNELRCKCGKTMLYCNGDVRDVTAMDVNAVKCWSCGRVKWLGDEVKPEDWKDWAVESYPRPSK